MPTPADHPMDVVAKLADATLSISARQKLMRQVAEARDRRFLAVLTDLVGDPERRIRYSAMQAVRRVGGSDAIEPLVGALHHDDPVTAAWAAIGLRQLGATDRAPQILAVAQERWSTLDNSAKTTFVSVLAAFRDADAIPLFAVGVKSGDRTLRKQSANGLACVGTAESRKVLDSALRELSPWRARAVRQGMHGPGLLRRMEMEVIDA